MYVAAIQRYNNKTTTNPKKQQQQRTNKQNKQTNKHKIYNSDTFVILEQGQGNQT